jgi:hypothetical protein
VIVMPVKKENMHLYPGGNPNSKEWRVIRNAILKRAANCCEQCRVENGAIIVRGIGVHAGTFMMPNGDLFDADDGRRLGAARGSEYDGKMLKVVLTIAHLDHDPGNNVPGNLKALCQLHHLRHDAVHHSVNSARTRRLRRASGDLFPET